ncbi:MAG: IPT/TIG domain-containing protein [Microthrixaceae bacterium]
MKFRKTALLLAPAAMALASCQVPVTMWGSCQNAADGNPTGTDNQYVLVCKDGVWTPIMTVGEFAQLSQGKTVTIASLPTQPTTTTTTTAAPTTTSTTTTTVPLAPPTVTGTADAEGPLAGGNEFTVLGTNFTGTTGVTVDGTSATFVVVNNSTLTVTAPAHAAGPAAIIVTNADGTSDEVPEGTYHYRAVPTADSLSPTTADVGDTITITGTGYGGGVWVEVGTTPAPNSASVDGTSATFEVPAVGAGTYDVVIHTAGGSVTVTNGLTVN